MRNDISKKKYGASRVLCARVKLLVVCEKSEKRPVATSDNYNNNYYYWYWGLYGTNSEACSKRASRHSTRLYSFIQFQRALHRLLRSLYHLSVSDARELWVNSGLFSEYISPDRSWIWLGREKTAQNIRNRSLMGLQFLLYLFYHYYHYRWWIKILIM